MPHVVFAHGFSQTAASWSTIERLLSWRVDELTSIALDLPGHGTASDLRGDLWVAADHLVAQGSAGTYVGYSMGGRVALHVALRHPQAVRRLVLIGATAGIDDARERFERRAADEALADRIERIGLPAFLDEWLSNPLFAGLTEETAQLEDRLRNTPVGLANSLRDAGTGTQTPLWDRLGEIRCPALVLVGEHDAKFRALGDRLVEGLSDARLVVVPGAGHSVHLEQPDATADALAQFLDDG